MYLYIYTLLYIYVYMTIYIYIFIYLQKYLAITAFYIFYCFLKLTDFMNHCRICRQISSLFDTHIWTNIYTQ